MAGILALATMAFQGLGGISSPPKRSDDRSRTRLFPNPVAWKGCRFDSAAGCPRASLRPEEAADLVGQVLGDLDETMMKLCATRSCSNSDNCEAYSMNSTTPIGTSRSLWTADGHDPGVPEMLRRKGLFAQPTYHMKLTLNADLFQKLPSVCLGIDWEKQPLLGQSRAEDLCVEH